LSSGVPTRPCLHFYFLSCYCCISHPCYAKSQVKSTSYEAPHYAAAFVALFFHRY
jgi:hypothetical protein